MPKLAHSSGVGIREPANDGGGTGSSLGGPDMKQLVVSGSMKQG